MADDLVQLLSGFNSDPGVYSRARGSFAPNLSVANAFARQNIDTINPLARGTWRGAGGSLRGLAACAACGPLCDCLGQNGRQPVTLLRGLGDAAVTSAVQTGPQVNPFVDDGSRTKEIGALLLGGALGVGGVLAVLHFRMAARHKSSKRKSTKKRRR